MSRIRKVGLVTHESSLRHDTTPGHPERRERMEAISAHLTATGLADKLDAHHPERAGRGLLELVHDAELIARIEAVRARGGGQLDLDTSMGPRSLEAAERAARGAVDAVERVLEGTWSSAFVCMRPPGHHATRRQAMGFCLFNHVACAARWAVAEGRAERVLIVDWDAHHGNGTQDIFWADPSVLYVSLHQYPWYPGTGDATERGDGEAAGTTLNVPLPRGAAEDAFDLAFEELVAPAVERFAPDVVLVSAGYDAHHADPLCALELSAGAFFRMARRVESFGRGPVCVLEGGYDLDALAWSASATISALLGLDAPAGVPPGELDPRAGMPEARRWVERALALNQQKA